MLAYGSHICSNCYVGSLFAFYIVVTTCVLQLDYIPTLRVLGNYVVIMM